MAGVLGAPGEGLSGKRGITSVLFDKLTDIIGFYFSIIVSNRLINNPFLGGAVFIAGQLAVLYLSILSSRIKTLIPRRERFKYYLIAFLSAIAALSLLILYPMFWGNVKIPFLLLFTATQIAGYQIVADMPLVLEKSAAGVRRYSFYWAMVILTVSILFIWPPGPDIHWIIISYYAITSILMILSHSLRRGGRTPGVNGKSGAIYHPEAIQDILEINAYRFYWNMNANLSVAFEISVMVLVCYIPFLRFSGFWSFLFDAAILVGLYFLAAAASKFLIRKRLRELGKNSAFIVFSVIWITTNLFLYRHTGALNAVQLWISFLTLCLCITGLASITISMDSDMRAVGELGVREFSISHYNMARKLMDSWGMIVSRFILLILSGILSFAVELNPNGGAAEIEILGKYGITLIPAVFLLLGVIAALKQPLTKYYEAKLKKYIRLKKEGKTNSPLEERLRSGLIEKYRKRIGLKIIIMILKPFFRHKVLGRENVDLKTMPCVFACNHSEIYGPVSAILNMPFNARPWVTNNMIDLKKISRHIQEGTFDRQKWLPAAVRKRLGATIGPIAAWAMRSTDPIPVYKGVGRDILRGIELSVEALEIDDNILLFPEDPSQTGGYLREGVGDFFPGFVNIAKAYFRETGRRLTFYSIFADKKRRTLSFSKGITFNPEAPFHEEKRRIADFLHESMVEMSTGNINSHTCTL